MSSYIALNKLVISDRNVRTVTASNAAEKRLMASIMSQGILQNLVVIPSKKGKSEVIAGARRLACLQLLAKQKKIKKDYPVFCSVKSAKDDCTEISLSENTQREAMHPSDQFVAFCRMVDEGYSVANIAERFGVTKKLVEQRLALGKVAPLLLGFYRQEKFDLDCLMAFSVIDDHARQLACYKELSNSGLFPRAIKNWLVGESFVLSQGIGKFIGKARYLKAGGAISTDLFGDETYLCDSELVQTLAQQLLTVEADKLKAEGGWSWIKVGNGECEHIHLQPVLVNVPKGVNTKITNMEKKVAQIEESGDAEGWPENIEAQFDKANEKLGELEEARNKDYLVFTPEQMAYSGCTVSVDYQGKLSVTKGLANSKDIPQPETSNTKDESKATDTDNKPKGISQALTKDLGTYRQDATKAVLLTKPALAMDILLYSVCYPMLSGNYWHGQQLMDVTMHPVDSTTKLGDTGEGTKAYKARKAFEASLETEWTAIEAAGERLAAFIALPKKAKDKLVAFCVAESLTIGVRNTDSAQDAVVDLLAVPFSDYWRPTTENYLSRLSKPLLFEQFTPIRSQDWQAIHSDMKKLTVVENMGEWFKGTSENKTDPRKTWIPVEF